MRSLTFTSASVKEANKSRSGVPMPGVLKDPRQMTLTPSGQWKRGDTRWSSHGSGVVHEPMQPRSMASYRRLQVATCVKLWSDDKADRLVSIGAVVLTRRQERARLRAGV
jgi:hypothetical protein